ncbi:MAG: WD40 repeat domain-containing protein [Planctomycetia bacterium]|nr:WD40 repeat domain-containing protein [Planctomycetia bacterium]
MRLPRELHRLLFLIIPLVCGCGSEPASNSGPSADSQPDSPQQVAASERADVSQAGTASLSVAIAPKPPAKPSPEQIAKWDVPAYVPLQLLACNDGFDDPAVQCLAVSPDGKQFALGGSKLTLWNTQDAQPTVDLLTKYKPDEVERPIRAAAISADGKWLVAGDEKGTVRIWTLSDQKEVVAIPAHKGYITELALSPNSRLLATTSYSGDVHLWQLPEGKQLKSLKVDKQKIHHLAFLSDDRLAAAGSEAGIWNVETGAKETALTTKHLMSPALALSSDRRSLAFSDADATLQFWDVQSSKSTGSGWRGAGAQLISFSHDGKWIATYANNSEIRIWDTAAGRLVQVIDADGEQTSALEWLPNCNGLLISSESRLRIWGTADAAAAIGMKSMVLPTPATPVAGAQQAMSPAQMQRVIDIRSFPRLPGAVPKMNEFGFSTYVAPATQADAELYYRYALEKAGWTEAPPSPMTPGLIFDKDGCRLNVSFASAADYGTGTAGELQVSLQFEGNYDARWLPKLPVSDWKGTHESFSSCMYRTKTALTDAEATLLKQLHAAGWTAYTRLAASGSEDPRSRTLKLLQGGSVLTVSLQNPADSPNELAVQTNLNVSNQSLPLPPDAGWIEFDASTDLQCVVNTKMNLQDAIDFYDNRMAAEGWLRREAGRHTKDGKAWLPYVRGQQDLFLRLAELSGGGTRVVVGDAASSSWQLQPPAEKPVDKTSEPGLQAADFTLPAGAMAVKYDVDAKNIEFEVADTTPPKLGELFAKQMEALGWKRDGAGIVADDYTFITYEKNKAEIQLRSRPADKKATAMIGGDGMLWTKPLPTAPVRISYETWLRRNRYDATLDRLDAFVAEMHKIPVQSPNK